MVCEMTIAASGEMTDYNFYEAMIHSHARMTYNEVSDIIELAETDAQKSIQKKLRKRNESLIDDFENLYSLFHALKAVRESRGAMDFDSTETRIVFGEDRKIREIVPVVRNDAHRIIEECMLCANVAAASLLEESKLPALYRVHEGPNPTKLENLRLFLKELDLHLPGGDKPEPADYQYVLKQMAGRPDRILLQTMLIRSLMQAVYQPENLGHFGLGFEAYAHFTSPIRRYPDLLVHRAIRSLIRGKPCAHTKKHSGAADLARKNIYPYDLKDMIQFGENCSTAERRADAASYSVIDALKCEYMQDRVGDEFVGTVTAVTSFGLFVELNDIYVEGLVHINNLGNDFVHFDQAQQRLLGERTRKVYRLGDAIDVVVARVDLDERKVDLEINAVAKRGGVKKASAKKGADKNTAGRKGSGKKADSTKNKTGQKDKKKNGGKKRKAKALAKAGSKRKSTGGKSSDGRSSDDKPNNGKSKKPAAIAKPLKKNKVKKTQEKNKSDHTTAKPVKPVRKQSKATAKKKKSRP